MVDKSTPTVISPLDLDAEVPPDQSLEVVVNPSVSGMSITRSGHGSNPTLLELVAEKRDVVNKYSSSCIVISS